MKAELIKDRAVKRSDIVLSKRLKMIADMVTPGNRLADVGCDHGFLSIYLVQSGICPVALAMDVRKCPLASAGEHVAEFGLGDYIETRLSDGLTACEAGEADTLVCAGMGGPLMEKILTESMDKVKQLKELILQPQSELKEFRGFLRKSGFVITKEDAVIDEGKYYFVMKAVWRGEVPCQRQKLHLYDTFGEILLQQKHPVLLAFLKQRKSYLKQLEADLTAAGSEKAVQRTAEISRELADIEDALNFF